mgnify:FL=1
MKKRTLFVSLVALGCLGLTYLAIGYVAGKIWLAEDERLQKVAHDFKALPFANSCKWINKQKLDCNDITKLVIKDKENILKTIAAEDRCLVGLTFTFWVHDPHLGGKVVDLQGIDLCWPRRI